MTHPSTWRRAHRRRQTGATHPLTRQWRRVEWNRDKAPINLAADIHTIEKTHTFDPCVKYTFNNSCLPLSIATPLSQSTLPMTEGM